MRRRSYESVKRAATAEETRERLIAAVQEILSEERGRTPFSMETVATRAGVTRLTIYHQFRNRRGLIEAVVDKIAVEGGINELPTVFAEQDPMAAFHRFVSIFCSVWETRGNVLPRLSRELAEEGIADILEIRSDHRRQALGVLVGRLHSNGSDPERTNDLIDTLHVMTGFEFFRNLRSRNRSAAQTEALVHRLIDAVLAEYGR